ncbi:FHA domain-containing protein [Massilia endophytica]|uniref:FHA domain-containing protein n=1 Tax=Massilia endophytica TaxID=2899220 RepID=UPI001E62425B|nr:FHA domain-containing protein [Massilia endophytica]UGQ45831.1 FHA domain-containing protein [Massilia endophytica]
MAKLIISREGNVEQTVQLTKERMTVGRRRHNDIVLDHPTVSGEHAVVTTILDDSFLEDLHSTNGTFVNGQRVAKHILQDKDVITLAKYKIAFVADGIRPAAPAAAARIEVLNGRSAGKQLALSKALTSLGRPGVQVVVIARTPQGYSAAHTEGSEAPTLNGKPLSREPQRLADGDVLDLGGTQMVFRG